jgi:hypothetical protein
MRLGMIAFATLICLMAVPGFAQSTTGFLVDSDCYESLERNVNPWDTNTYVDRDRDWEVRYCSPDRKTKSFTLVNHDGLSFKLDPAGNAKAAELLGSARKKSVLEVSVTGEVSRAAIKVSSISRAK